jgi:UDP-GlcNAc:undecaprenyl-phosphate GlcNAc-1-phosphate transferase
MVLTALTTPVARRLALAIGAVDEPSPRRVHSGQIPRMGGIAMVVGFFAPLAGLYVIDAPVGRALFSITTVMIGLVIGAVLLVAVGLLDDIRGVGAKHKLFVQIAAATAAYACGMRIQAIDVPGIGVWHLGALAWPATVAWFVGIINAVNLIDGLDGLAAGVVFFACLTNFVIAALAGNYLILFVTASLGGAVIGFLFYNFNPARIFMGDTGSMFLGFVLAAASLLGAGTQKTPTLLAMVVPIVALGLPITDMLVTIVRRFFARRSIFAADREHIHHRLLDLGLTHRRAVLALYLLSVAFTVLALAVHLGRSWQVGAALFVLCALLVGVVRFMGHFNSTAAAVSRVAAQENSESFRRAVPRVLRQLADVGSFDKARAVLAEFGQETRLLALAIVDSDNRQSPQWRWELPGTAGSAAQDVICTKFDVSDGSKAFEVQFFSDSAAGIVGASTHILLQLVADGVESVLVLAVTARESQPSALVRHKAQVLLPGP